MFNCKSNYDSEKCESLVSVFYFPKDEDRKKKWVKFVHRKDWTPTKNSVICIKHFHEKYIDRSYPRLRLKPDAVPSKQSEDVPHYLNGDEAPERRDF